MDLIKERNGFVYGCISLGVACGVGWRGAGGAGDYGCLAVGARARRRLLELRLGIRIRIRLSPLTLTGTRTRTPAANALDSRH